MNLLTGVASPGQRVVGDREAAAQLGLRHPAARRPAVPDRRHGQPFILLLIAPVTLAAATLPLRPLLVWAAWPRRLAGCWRSSPCRCPRRRRSRDAAARATGSAAAIANIAGIALIAGYVRQAAAEAARMALALDVTQAVLAREQRLSALGAPGRRRRPRAGHAAGHHLHRRQGDGPRGRRPRQVKEDAELLIAQAERCREILRRLTDTPDEATDEVHERMSLRQLVHEVIEPHADGQGRAGRGHRHRRRRA